MGDYQQQNKTKQKKKPLSIHKEKCKIHFLNGLKKINNMALQIYTM